MYELALSWGIRGCVPMVPSATLSFAMHFADGKELHSKAPRVIFERNGIEIERRHWNWEVSYNLQGPRHSRIAERIPLVVAR